jgi:hypothetical protein
LGGTQDFNKLSIKEKVFIRKTGSSIISVYDDTGIIPEQSLYFIYSDENNPDDLLVLSSILNSKIIDCYFKNFGITNRDSTPQLKKTDLDKFPIIFPKENTLLKLTKEIYYLMKKDQRDNLINKEIEKLNFQINKVIVSLYGLNKDEEYLLIDQKKIVKKVQATINY